ncbi:MAG: hypothetical protein AAGJ97_14225, partial [Planctomycetota bacterium]
MRLSVVLVLSAFAATPARADYVTLSDGGIVRGKVVEPEFGVVATGEAVRVVTPAGLELRLDSGEVRGIVRRDPRHEELARRAAVAGNDAASQWELAEFARVNRLDAARARHLRAVIAADPGHRDARVALGYVRENGAWMTRHDAMTARGLVEHDGRYVTPQEKELLELSEAERERRRYWFGKIRLWTKWAGSGDADRVYEAGERFASVDEPAAIPAVLKFLGGAADVASRLLAVRTVAQIAGPAATDTLVAFSLRDGSKIVADTARRAIVGAPGRHESARVAFGRGLGDANNLVVRRSALGLEQIGGAAAIPGLIAALVTRHLIAFEVPDRGSLSVGFGQAPFLPPSIEFGLRTGQFPDGVIITEDPLQPTPPTKTVRVGRVFRNREVLSALLKITGDESLRR